MKVAVIGAGASGLVASIIAAKNKNKVIVFEKNNDAGKKLLLTGNGRCNYGSAKQELMYYHSKEENLIKEIINENNLKKVKNFFDELGVIPKLKNNCYYPFSEKASSIKSALICAAKEFNVEFRFNTNVDEIIPSNGCFIINNECFDKVILATGSKCAPKTGSTGDGYLLAKKLNHDIVDVNPSLMQLVSNMGMEKNWVGIRCESIVKHYENGILKKEEEGELQLTSYGLSGICIFNLSRDIRIGLNNGQKEEVHINFVPWLKEDVMTFLDKRASVLRKRNLTELCDGFLDYNLVYALLKYLNIDSKSSWDDLNSKMKRLFADALFDFKVNIIDTNSFDEAQTCSGGISLKDINLKTMESLKVKNLYFAGEIIDLDGDCGGYNLTVAWITGLIAGEDHD